MPKKVERVISKIMSSSGVSQGSAIAIAKSRGLVKQKGKHLAAGSKLKKRRKSAAETLRS